MQTELISTEKVIEITDQWVKQFIIELNICPFAYKPVKEKKIRYVVSHTKSENELVALVESELNFLHQHSTSEIETTLVIHPNVLVDFLDYNDFLEIADDVIVELGYDGIFQIASFHPEYQFADTQPNDPENYTNRSPFPMLHILREESVEHAIQSYPNVDQIPLDNIARMKNLGIEKIKTYTHK